jgi:hypothetical protein
VPVAGKPLSTTLPVGEEHVGVVIDPTMGAAGITGCDVITISGDGEDMHPIELVTV